MNTREGLQMFSQGMGQLGEGVGAYAEHKKRSQAAADIRNRPIEDFQGGETGRTQAARAMRAGKEEIAAKLTLDEADSPVKLMTRLTNQYINEKDPAKRATIAKAQSEAWSKLRKVMEFQRSVTNNYGPNVPASAYDMKPIKAKELLVGLPPPPKKTNMIGVERDRDTYNSELQAWKTEVKDALGQRIDTKLGNFPYESRNNLFNNAFDMIQSGAYGDDPEAYFEENPDATISFPVVSQQYVKGRGTTGPVTDNKKGYWLYDDAPPAQESVNPAKTNEVAPPPKKILTEEDIRNGNF